MPRTRRVRGHLVSAVVIPMSDGSSPTALVGPNSRDWEEAASRPSKTNCTSPPQTSEGENSSSQRRQWWREKNQIVNEFSASRPSRAARPVSVRGGTTLREECALPKQGDETRYRSKSWSEVLNEFLKWYNGYRDAHLVFESPEGEIVRGQMKNAHQPSYGDRYYARLKALERQIMKYYDNPTVVMLTLTGSNRNANGGWRCPADHLRDVVNSWRPDEGRGVYHALYDSLRDYEWEYAVVVEKHRSGYGHVHIAVFIDGIVTDEDFHPAIDAHLRACDIADRDAHDYFHADRERRPISVRRVASDSEDVQKEGLVRNVASYIGEYIGSYGEALFERGLDELMFRAACWATGTQMVRFSTGANEYISQGLKNDQTEHSSPLKAAQRCDIDLLAANQTETGEDTKPEIDGNDWSIVGIGRIDDKGEEIHDIRQSQVEWRKIDDASHIDPPKHLPPDQPTSIISNHPP